MERTKTTFGTLPRRVGVLVLALFLMAFGIVLCIRADLGISPISLFPYVLSLGLKPTIGQFTIALHVLFILGQVVLLKHEFRKLQYLQLAMTVVFGFFIDFSMWLTGWFVPHSYVMQLLTLVCGCALMEAGVNFELMTRTLLLPSEGIALAIVRTVDRPYKSVKIIFDVSLLGIGFLTSVMLLHRVEGIREGTVISAFLVGLMVGWLQPCQQKVGRWMNKEG